MKMAKLAILVEKTAAEQRWRYGLNVFGKYVEEIMAHVGIPFEIIVETDASLLAAYDIVIVAIAGENSTSVSELWSYAEQGGIVIAYAGMNGLASKFGFIQSGDIGAGYAILGTGSGQPEKLRFLMANPWIYGKDTEAVRTAALMTTSGNLVKENPDGRDMGPALQIFKVGEGFFHRWAVDIPSTVVYMQQGIGPVLDDGVPAVDGTGNVNEDILKADDRLGLDWEYDRLKTETDMPYFAWPYADYWREALIGHLLRCALDRGLTLPFTSYWPEGISRVATISHDSDGNQDAHALAALQLLDECEIQTTWCMLEPGYSAEIYDKVKQNGHELAFHYNAFKQDRGKWDEEELNRQFDWLKKSTNLQGSITNKNHYTRFEGWGELFLWLERCGIVCDQTRGPSKKGNVGFLFGTCHPYVPIAWSDEQNRFYRVMEIGFLTQDLDLGHLSDHTVIEPFLQQVRQVDGVAHFLFHQVHIHNFESVRDAVRMVVSQARQQGFVFWTSKQIHDWTRLRRSMRITGFDAGEGLKLETDGLFSDVVVWIPVASGSSEQVEGCELRFGVLCRKIVMSGSINEH